MEVLHVDFRASWVLLAAAISFMGAHAAVSLCEQVRIALSNRENSHRNIGLLVLMSIALGGVCFFGAFYIGMNALRLRTALNEIVLIEFDRDLVIGSAFVTTTVTFLGIYVASFDECFSRSKKDIMELFIIRASKTMAIGEIKHLGKFKILFSVCTSSLGRVLAGGIICGGAVCIQLYMGLLSVNLKGNVRFQSGYFAVGLIYAFIGVVVGFWVFFRVLSVFNDWEILRTFCSAIGLFVMCGANFITLAGVKFEYNPLESLPENSVLWNKIVFGILTSTVLFSFFVLLYVLADLRAWLLRASVQLSLADRALLSLLNRPHLERQQGRRVKHSIRACASPTIGTVTAYGDLGATAAAAGGGQLTAATHVDNTGLNCSAKVNQPNGSPVEVLQYTARFLKQNVDPLPLYCRLPQEHLLEGAEAGIQQVTSPSWSVAETPAAFEYSGGTKPPADRMGRPGSSSQSVFTKNTRPVSRIYPGE